MFPETGGTAALSGRDLPPASVLAADKHLTALAQALQAAGTPGTLDTLRARAYLHLLTGQPASTLILQTATPGRPGRDPPRPTRPPPPGQYTSPAAPPPARAPAGHGAPPRRRRTPSRSRPGGLPGLRGTVNLTMPLTAWLGWTQSPGDVPGYGPLDADDSRTLAGQLAQDPASQWCVTLTGPAGHPVAHACAATAPQARPPRPATPREQPRPPGTGTPPTGPGPTHPRPTSPAPRPSPPAVLGPRSRTGSAASPSPPCKPATAPTTASHAAISPAAPCATSSTSATPPAPGPAAAAPPPAATSTTSPPTTRAAVPANATSTRPTATTTTPSKSPAGPSPATSPAPSPGLHPAIAATPPAPPSTGSEQVSRATRPHAYSTLFPLTPRCGLGMMRLWPLESSRS